MGQSHDSGVTVGQVLVGVGIVGHGVGSSHVRQSHDSGVTVGQVLVGQVVVGHGVGSSQVGLVGGGSVLKH